MAKYRVIVDKGVEIGGRRYPHDAVVDSENLAAKHVPVPPIGRKATEAQKAAHAEAEAQQAAQGEAQKVQGVQDLEALLKRGSTPDSGPPFLEPYVEQKEG